MKDRELNRRVEDSGWVDGAWHSLAAINPSSEIESPPRYPRHDYFGEGYGVYLLNGEVRVATLTWTGNPAKTLQTRTTLEAFKHGSGCIESDVLGIIGKNVEAGIDAQTTLEQILTGFDHTPIRKADLALTNDDRWPV